MVLESNNRTAVDFVALSLERLREREAKAVRPYFPEVKQILLARQDLIGDYPMFVCTACGFNNSEGIYCEHLAHIVKGE